MWTQWRPGEAHRVVDRGAGDFGADAASLRPRLASRKPRVGFRRGAEADDARDAAFAGGARQTLETRVVAVEDRRAAFAHAGEDFRLCRGDGREVGEELQMRGRDLRNDRDIGPRDVGEHADLADAVHTHFEHREIA